MKKLGVIANCRKERSAIVLSRLAEKAAALGLELFADEATASLVGAGNGVSSQEMFEQVEAVIALGGDGTMLRAVRELDGRERPVMGINIGGLGFLTSVAEEDLDCAIECLAKDDFMLTTMAVAECSVERDGKTVGTYRSMNDVVVSRRPSSRILTLDVSVDGEKVTSYACDGVIVSTPAGSTGHSLSAGGPILTPATPAFVISVICPHTLSSRPLVVPDRSEICILAAQEEGESVLDVDGQVGQPLQPGDCVKVRRSDSGVCFIHLPGHSYFGVLRQKLQWSGSSVRKGPGSDKGK